MVKKVLDIFKRNNNSQQRKMPKCHTRINIPGQPTHSQWFETRPSQSEAIVEFTTPKEHFQDF